VDEAEVAGPQWEGADQTLALGAQIGAAGMLANPRQGRHRFHGIRAAAAAHKRPDDSTVQVIGDEKTRRREPAGFFFLGRCPECRVAIMS